MRGVQHILVGLRTNRGAPTIKGIDSPYGRVVCILPRRSSTPNYCSTQSVPAEGYCFGRRWIACLFVYIVGGSCVSVACSSWRRLCLSFASLFCKIEPANNVEKYGLLLCHRPDVARCCTIDKGFCLLFRNSTLLSITKAWRYMVARGRVRVTAAAFSVLAASCLLFVGTVHNAHQNAKSELSLEEDRKTALNTIIAAVMDSAAETT